MFVIFTTVDIPAVPIYSPLISGVEARTTTTGHYQTNLLQKPLWFGRFSWVCAVDGVCLGYPATIWCASFARDPIFVLTSMALDLPDNPPIHAIFLFLFVVSMLSLFLTIFCDRGICGTETKDGLKPVRTMPQPFT